MKQPTALHFAVAAALLGTPAVGLAQSAAERALSIGDSREGEITSDDAVDPARGYPADVWSFEGEQGAGVGITMRADVLDCYLTLRGPDGTVVAEDDDSGGDFDAMIMARLPATGRYEIVASGFAGATGAYRVALTTADVAGLPDPSAPISTVPIAFNSEVQGTIGGGDALFQSRGTLADAWTFDAEAGQEIEAHLSSPDFDAWLALVGPTFETVTSDDDSGDGTNSRVRFTATVSGTYRLVATTYSVGSSGEYTLSLRDRITPPTEGATELSVGGAAEGQLVDGAARFWVDATAGEPLLFAVSSASFDSTIEISDGSDYVLAFGDDTGDSLDASARVVPTSDGVLVARVSDYNGGTGGTFTIRVDRPEPVVVRPVALRMDRTLDGELTDTDARGSDGTSIVDVYTLTMDPGDVATVSLTTGAVGMQDMYGDQFALRVFSPLGEESYDMTPNYGHSTGQRRVVRASVGGTWLVSVTSWGGLGEYSIGVAEGAVAAPNWPDTPTGTLNVGYPINGTFSSDDPRHPERSGAMQIYTLTLDETTSVDVSLTSPEFDTWLEIRDENHEIIEYNDDYEGLNSRIQTTLSAGTYEVVATQYGGGDTGTFTLNATLAELISPTVGALQVGQSVSGTAVRATGSTTGRAGAWYALELSAGQSVTFRADSEAIDTIITLYDELGSVVAMNDDVDGTLNSRLALTLPRGGRYVLAVESLGGEPGPFNASVSEGIDGDAVTPYTDVYGGGVGYPYYEEPYFDAYGDPAWLDE